MFENSTNEQVSTAVTVVAEIPPPVRGDTLVTKLVVELLSRESSAVRIWDISSGRDRVDHLHKLGKMLGVFWSSLGLLVSRRKSGEALYTVANSGHGLLWNILTLWIAHFRGYRVFFHHHAYVYVRRYDWRMAILDAMVRRCGKHVFVCQCMVDDFQRHYGEGDHYVLVPETAILLDYARESVSRFSTDSVLRLGTLSNLTIEKGLDLTIETFARLHRAGRPVKLLLAGPASGPRERQLISAAIAEFGDDVEHLGSVYGDAKRRFYQQIDVFLFPTQYEIEVQPLVIAEAFAHGKPTIAFARACIPELMHDVGIAVPVDDDFVQIASHQIEKWMDDLDSLEELGAEVRSHARELLADAQQKIDEFLYQALRPSISREKV